MDNDYTFLRRIHLNVGIISTRTKNSKIGRVELVEALQEKGHRVVFMGRDTADEVHPDYLRHNIFFHPIKISRSNTNPFKEISAIINIRKAIKANNIEALFIYGIRTIPSVVIAAKICSVKRVICVVNGSGRLFQLKGIRGFLVKSISYPMLFLSFTLANTIFFQNPDDMNLIKRKKLLIKKNYETINGSGVNLNEYKLEKLNKKPSFSMISRLTGSKGVNEYVQAARLVKQDYPEAIFHLIGPMDNNDSSINMFELQMAVENGDISLIDKVEDVRPYIKECRFFVLPSYYPEGIPRSILEAMAMGRPIITTDSPGCRETVQEGVNGFLVAPYDYKTLKEKMVWMIENPLSVEKMGESSRNIASKKFDVHKINKVMLKKLRSNNEK